MVADSLPGLSITLCKLQVLKGHSVSGHIQLYISKFCPYSFLTVAVTRIISVFVPIIILGIVQLVVKLSLKHFLEGFPEHLFKDFLYVSGSLQVLLLNQLLDLVVC